MTRFILVAGGVISGVGKGVITASLGKILKEYDYSTTLIKIDPYINYDAGTLRPTEHGEVWVTQDGGEIDQDLGTYERFLDENISKKNNITTGQIYKSVIDKERHGHYLGQTVQFIPHIVDEIKRRILAQTAAGYEIAIIELGGTVGDYENAPYLFAVKALQREMGNNSVAYVLVTYLPIPAHIQEMKTKPTQQAIRLLGQEGVQPDFLVCRSEKIVDDVRKKKIEDFSHIPADHIIAAPDLATIYEMPLYLEQEKMGEKLLRHLHLPHKKIVDWSPWQTLVARIQKPKETVSIAIVGKYLEIGDYSLIDSYVSIYQAIIHAGAQLDIGVSVTWLNAKSFEQDAESVAKLKQFDGIIVPGGFGASGVEGKLSAIEFVRKNNVPFLGICYGLQLAVVEWARNCAGLQGAHTTEVDQHTPYNVIDLLPDQQTMLNEKDYGATMRLGNYHATVDATSFVYQLYKECGRVTEHTDGTVSVDERHRHRYEVHPGYVAQLRASGLRFSGYYQRADGTRLMEFLELNDHPFFVATQAHPEFTSRLGNPNPLFFGLIKAAADAKLQQLTFSQQKEHSQRPCSV